MTNKRSHRRPFSLEKSKWPPLVCDLLLLLEGRLYLYLSPLKRLSSRLSSLQLTSPGEKTKNSITMTANWKEDVELEYVEIRHRIRRKLHSLSR